MNSRAMLMTCGLILGATSPAHAELYLAVFGGAAFSESKVTETRIDLSPLGTALDGKLDKVDFNDSFLVGAKFGYFFTRPFLGGHFGTELELYYTQPEASSQTVTFSGTGLGVPPNNQLPLPSVSFEVFTVALNLLYRLPLFTSEAYPNGRLQPYIGVGVGAFFAKMETRASILEADPRIKDRDEQPGVQALGGLKFFVTRNVALFAEYRFAQTDEFTFDFKAQGTVMGGIPVTETARDRSDLTQHQAAFGIAIHW
ncbi:MAG: outer membrane protein [Candidatus Rokuibacteriota bacterium]